MITTYFFLNQKTVSITRRNNTKFTKCNNFEWLMLVFMFEQGKPLRGFTFVLVGHAPQKMTHGDLSRIIERCGGRVLHGALPDARLPMKCIVLNAVKWMQQVAWQGSGNNCRGLQTWVGGDVIRFCGWRRTLRDHTRNGRLQAKFDEHFTAGAQDNSCSCSPTDIRLNQPL